MKIAQKIISANEALQDSTQEALKSWSIKASKSAASLNDKVAKEIATTLSSIASSIEEKDEKGALEDIKKLSAKIKKLDIED